MEENNSNNINTNNNKNQSPQTATTMNETNNNDLIINKQTINLTIDIHLPIADRTLTESKLSFNSSRVDNKSIQPKSPLLKQQIKRVINNVKKINKIEFPLVKQSKTMPIIKENMSTTDVCTNSSDFKSNKKKSKTAPLLNKDMKSAPSYFSGYPVSNGFLAMKVNPTFINEFSYLNRNKLVNRRLSLRKQMHSSTLKAISILPEEFESIKSVGEFALGNPNGFNKLDEQYLEFTARSNLTNNINNNNNKEIEQNRFVITPDSLKLLDGTINIESDMIMKAAANSFENVIPLNDFNNNEEKPQRLIKSSSIVVLEKNNNSSDQKYEEPSPVSYHIPRRPPNQKNSPMYTIGRRCFNEKSGGGRTSWEKEWFNSSNPFTIKSDFKRDQTWPTPVNYNLKSTIGADSNSSLYYQYPSVKIHNNTPLSGRASHLNNPSSDGVCSCHMILSRQDLIEMELKKSNTLITTSNTDLNNKNSNNLNNNNNNSNSNNKNNSDKKDYLDLNIEQSAKYISARAPKVKFQFRNNGTQLWPQVEKTPGPGYYDHNKFSSVAKKRPNFSVAQARLNLNSNYNVGPFAAL